LKKCLENKTTAKKRNRINPKNPEKTLRKKEEK
jgi:hypothetical protein